MVRYSEAQLESWTRRASDAEQSRYEWTRQEIRAALAAPRLSHAAFTTYAKGSYPNHTNVVRDSDVDVAVELTSIVRYDFHSQAKGLTLGDIGVTPYTGAYSLRTFKDDVEASLREQFGSAAVVRGNKAIHVNESRRGLKADVVVCQSFVDCFGRGSSGQRPGILIEPDRGVEIENFPKQHLDEGVMKNARCQRRYKRVVRILKRLENEMVRLNVSPVVPSYLIESLVWNVPDAVFNTSWSWQDRLRSVLEYIYNSDRSGWLEANNVKYLMHVDQKWSDTEAATFIERAWRHAGYGNA